MAMKNFYTFSLEKFESEKLALEECMKTYEKNRRKEETVLEHPEMQSLLSEYFKIEKEDLHKWEIQPYDKYTGYPNQLLFKTPKGEYVRSKSEALIAMHLYYNKIPYRYECGLDIGGRIIYPDFTIRHPRTGKIIYWEHCGRMSDPKYVNDIAQKIKTFATMGICPFENLIMTYERDGYPLDIGWVEKIIEYYFLD